MKWFITGMEKLIHGKKFRKIVAVNLISLLVVTLVFSMNTKVALADDYSVTWYTASENPINCTSVTASYIGTSLDDAWESTLGKYGYVDFIVHHRIDFAFSGFVNGYSYRWAPYASILVSFPQNFPLTSFSYDEVFLDSYSYGSNNINDIQVYQGAGSQKYNLALGFRFFWDWVSLTSSVPTIAIDLTLKVRAYCSDASALSGYALGQLATLYGTFTQSNGNALNTSVFTKTGCWIANFSMMQGSASQFNNSSLMAGYLYDIRNALVQQPDTDYTAALDSAQSALDTEQDARDDVFQQVDQFYMTDADTLLTLDDIDSNVGVGLDFWFDWVNAYFNKAEEVDANKPLTLNIIFNFISRLF